MAGLRPRCLPAPQPHLPSGTPAPTYQPGALLSVRPCSHSSPSCVKPSAGAWGAPCPPTPQEHCAAHHHPTQGSTGVERAGARTLNLPSHCPLQTKFPVQKRRRGLHTKFPVMLGDQSCSEVALWLLPAAAMLRLAGSPSVSQGSSTSRSHP